MARTILQAIFEYFAQSAPLNDAFPGGLWPDFAPEEARSKPYLLLVDHEQVPQFFTAGHVDDNALEQTTVTLRVTAAGLIAADNAAKIVMEQFDFKQDGLPLDGSPPTALLNERLKYKLYGLNLYAGGQPITHGDVQYKFWFADQHH